MSRTLDDINADIARLQDEYASVRAAQGVSDLAEMSKLVDTYYMLENIREDEGELVHVTSIEACGGGDYVVHYTEISWYDGDLRIRHDREAWCSAGFTFSYGKLAITKADFDFMKSAADTAIAGFAAAVENFMDKRKGQTNA